MFAVVLGVVLGGLVRRVGGVQAMGVREMRVVAALLVLALLVVLRGLAMMMGRLGMMLGRRFVMLAVLVGLGSWLILGLVAGDREPAPASLTAI